jgi:hypothetical protein
MLDVPSNSSNIYTPLNTHFAIGNEWANLDMTFVVRPLGMVKFLTFGNTLLFNFYFTLYLTIPRPSNLIGPHSQSPLCIGLRFQPLVLFVHFFNGGMSC